MNVHHHFRIFHFCLCVLHYNFWHHALAILNSVAKDKVVTFVLTFL